MDEAPQGRMATSDQPEKAGGARDERGGTPGGARDLNPRARFSLVYYLVAAAVIWLLDSMFFSGTDVPEWSYSQFIDAVQSGHVVEVVITTERIYGQQKSEATSADKTSADKATNVEKATTSGRQTAPMELPAKKAPWHLEKLLDWWRGVRGDIEAARAQQQAEAKQYFTVLPLPDPNLLTVLQSHGVDYRGRIESHALRDFLLNWMVPGIIMFAIWGYFMRRMGRGPGVLQVGKSRAKIYEADQSQKVHFTDIAGVDEAIEETREIVSFLRDPTRFTSLGARLPKGVLLVGPPGTGKTLLAKAIAGESEVPFYSLSGSDFVEMFVGVGAARVRDLFVEAKKAAPCIVFIDELDAVGKARAQLSGYFSGGNDERENTLNQLLTEMDGFDASAGVVILAATNRPEVLDPALLRSGRFDRRVVVDRPSRSGRKAIFAIHTRKLPLADGVDFDALAAQTPGMVGADIANVCNEAALLASRREKTRISMQEFEEAIERTIAGPQKKGLIVTPQEKRRIAFHESGHALVGYLTPGGDPVQKISIIPRAAGALGYTLQMPLQDRYVLSRNELLDKVRVLLGGRAAESVVFDSISTGASDDLQRATEIVRDMVNRYGMSEKAPNVCLTGQSDPGYLALGPERAQVSEELARQLDAEVIATIGHAFEQARTLLVEKREVLDSLASTLLEKEELGAAEIIDIIGERPAADARWA